MSLDANLLLFDSQKPGTGSTSFAVLDCLRILYVCLKCFEQIYFPFPSPIPTLFSQNFSLSASSVPLLKVHGAHLLLPFCAKGLVPSARARVTRETS